MFTRRVILFVFVLLAVVVSTAYRIFPYISYVLNIKLLLLDCSSILSIEYFILHGIHSWRFSVAFNYKSIAPQRARCAIHCLCELTRFHFVRAGEEKRNVIGKYGCLVQSSISPLNKIYLSCSGSIQKCLMDDYGDNVRRYVFNHFLNKK